MNQPSNTKVESNIDLVRREPPRMEDILRLVGPVVDDLYDLGSLFGIKGTWLRLWGCLVLVWSFGDTSDEMGRTIAEIRVEFEELLGRIVTDSEWSALGAHAKSHAENVMQPIMKSLMGPSN